MHSTLVLVRFPFDFGGRRTSIHLALIPQTFTRARLGDWQGGRVGGGVPSSVMHGVDCAKSSVLAFPVTCSPSTFSRVRATSVAVAMCAARYSFVRVGCYASYVLKGGL